MHVFPAVISSIIPPCQILISLPNLTMYFCNGDASLYINFIMAFVLSTLHLSSPTTDYTVDFQQYFLMYNNSSSLSVAVYCILFSVLNMTYVTIT